MNFRHLKTFGISLAILAAGLTSCMPKQMGPAEGVLVTKKWGPNVGWENAEIILQPGTRVPWKYNQVLHPISLERVKFVFSASKAEQNDQEQSFWVPIGSISAKENVAITVQLVDPDLEREEQEEALRALIADYPAILKSLEYWVEDTYRSTIRGCISKATSTGGITDPSVYLSNRAQIWGIAPGQLEETDTPEQTYTFPTGFQDIKSCIQAAHPAVIITGLDLLQQPVFPSEIQALLTRQLANRQEAAEAQTRQAAAVALTAAAKAEAEIDLARAQVYSTIANLPGYLAYRKLEIEQLLAETHGYPPPITQVNTQPNVQVGTVAKPVLAAE